MGLLKKLILIVILLNIINMNIIDMNIINMNCFAKEFGTRGGVSQISEEAFLEMINRKLSKIDIADHQNKINEIAKERVLNPKPVKNISSATKSRSFYYDPTYSLTKDVVLPCGKILYKKGQEVNPLSHMDFNRRLFFINGNSKKEVKWLKDQLKSAQQDIEDRIILVGGSPIKLEKEIKQNIYFDQNGVLTSKFGIKHSPAIVVARPPNLLINEIKI